MSVELLVNQEIVVICAWCELVMTDIDRDVNMNEKMVSHSICIPCSEKLLDTDMEEYC